MTCRLHHGGSRPEGGAPTRGRRNACAGRSRSASAPSASVATAVAACRCSSRRSSSYIDASFKSASGARGLSPKRATCAPDGPWCTLDRPMLLLRLTRFTGAARSSEARSRPRPVVEPGARCWTSHEITMALEVAATAWPPSTSSICARSSSAQDAGRRRGKRVAALDGVSLHDVDAARCVAILGQNGSGKSTLVRLLSTLLLHDGGCAPSSATTRQGDARGAAARQPRLGRGELLQEDVRVENLSYAARFYGLPPSQTRDRIPEILARVGFPTDRRNEPMENLSRACSRRSRSRARC